MLFRSHEELAMVRLFLREGKSLLRATAREHEVVFPDVQVCKDECAALYAHMAAAVLGIINGKSLLFKPFSRPGAAEEEAMNLGKVDI